VATGATAGDEHMDGLFGRRFHRELKLGCPSTLFANHG
jgi:hypothetical protein